jgi:hypothetical protein
MGSRSSGDKGCALNRIYQGTRVKNKFRIKEEKLKEKAARAAKNKALLLRCRGAMEEAE